MNSTKIYTIALVTALTVPASLAADEFHNINGFFGERAAGLAGAYVAVSDDPSGMVYNPAGLVYAYDQYISLSVSSYSETSKEFRNVFGIGQDYTRTSRAYAPNFFGAITTFGDVKFGLAIVSPQQEEFDQADQIYYPQNGPNSAFLRTDFTDETTEILGGPALAISLGDRLSIGATIFGEWNSRRIISRILNVDQSGGYVSDSFQDRRRTISIVPVLGLQYMPTDELALGFSARRRFVTSGSRLLSSITTTSSNSAPDSLSIAQVTDKRFAVISQDQIITAPGVRGELPETYELRGGFAYFVSRYFLTSFDVIYTSGYRSSQQNIGAELLSRTLIVDNGDEPLLSREETLNVAAGLEYYVTDNFSLRGGFFTNKANSEDIDWFRAALIGAARSVIREGNLSATDVFTQSNIVVAVPDLAQSLRNEHVDLQGYTFGLAWGDATSSVSLSFSLERGRGGAQIDPGGLPQPLVYENRTVYLVASTRQ